MFQEMFKKRGKARCLIKTFLNGFYARAQGLQNPRNKPYYFRKQSQERVTSW